MIVSVLFRSYEPPRWDQAPHGPYHRLHNLKKLALSFTSAPSNNGNHLSVFDAMEEPTFRPFKVIVVGAGIAGLTLAHLLLKADIDFVVVEAHTDMGPPAGGSFGFWPNCARILDQIGCWDDVKNKGAPLEVNHVRGPNGRPFVTSRMAAKIHAEYICDSLSS